MSGAASLRQARDEIARLADRLRQKLAQPGVIVEDGHRVPRDFAHARLNARERALAELDALLPPPEDLDGRLEEYRPPRRAAVRPGAEVD